MGKAKNLGPISEFEWPAATGSGWASFSYESVIDDDCRFPLVASWTVNYHVKRFLGDGSVQVHLGDCELDAVYVVLMPGERCKVIAQTEGKRMTDFQEELRKLLDVEQLHVAAFDHHCKHPDAGSETA